MAAEKIKVESGLQLLARLSKKRGIENFYPLIFGQGPGIGDLIELFSDQSTNYVLEDIISESLVPKALNGVEANVLIFSTDGNFNLDSLINIMRKKIVLRMQSQSFDQSCKTKMLDDFVNSSLGNLFIIEIYDVTQFYTSIQNLENILAKYPHISLVVFDSISGFYWCEQEYQIKKIDMYLKNLISLIQKITKNHKVTILYSRPEYFSSKKQSIKNLEPCCEQATKEQVNYRIQVIYTLNKGHYVIIKTHNNIKRVNFIIYNNSILWM